MFLLIGVNACQTSKKHTRMLPNHLLVVLAICLLLGCGRNEKLEPVTVQAFADFIAATGYVTDAEKFGWTFDQKDVYNFEVVEDVNWRNAYGKHTLTDHLPVIQVSYNDVNAYIEWSGFELPDYDQYWELVKQEEGIINSNSPIILATDQCQVVGNVWEITLADEAGRIRLAGGSYLCNVNSCNGTSSLRELYIDATTGNSNIGFAVVKAE